VGREGRQVVRQAPASSEKVRGIQQPREGRMVTGRCGRWQVGAAELVVAGKTAGGRIAGPAGSEGQGWCQRVEKSEKEAGVGEWGWCVCVVVGVGEAGWGRRWAGRQVKGSR